jgi:hypothetical protein
VAVLQVHKFVEVAADKDLGARLTDLLTVSTPPDNLQEKKPRPGKHFCPYLRLKQKDMDKTEWLVDGVMHNGAHFPLCVFTNNARARSEAGQEKRRIKRESSQNNSKGSKGSGKNKSFDMAVADPTNRSRGTDSRSSAPDADDRSSYAWTSYTNASAHADTVEEPWRCQGGDWSWSQSTWRA